MRNLKDTDHASRRTAAADAKAALLKSHLAAKEAAEPTRLAKQEERLSAAAAKAERQQERAKLKLAEEERILAEAALLKKEAEAAANSEAEAREKVQKDRVSRVINDEIAQKAERDRRYANRKAKKR